MIEPQMQCTHHRSTPSFAGPMHRCERRIGHPGAHRRIDEEGIVFEWADAEGSYIPFTVSFDYVVAEIRQPSFPIPESCEE